VSEGKERRRWEWKWESEEKEREEWSCFDNFHAGLFVGFGHIFLSRVGLIPQLACPCGGDKKMTGVCSWKHAPMHKSNWHEVEVCVSKTVRGGLSYSKISFYAFLFGKA
jgi:hypothetical protein